MSQTIASAHKVLEYALTKAAVSGKLTKTTLKIPYSELLESIGQKSDRSLDLIVTIELNWDETNDDEN